MPLRAHRSARLGPGQRRQPDDRARRADLVLYRTGGHERRLALRASRVLRIAEVLTYCFEQCPIMVAQRSPSIAAETIPPAYPAPSPHGYRPLTCGCCNVSLSRGMRTGDDVRDSVATIIPSSVMYPFILLPKAFNPSLKF